MTDYEEFSGLGDAPAADEMTPDAAEAAAGSFDLDGDTALFQECAAFPLNDTGNAKRFWRYFGDSARHVPRVGWHVWDGRRWRLDPDGIAVRGLGQQLHENIAREVPFAPLTATERSIVDRIAAARKALDTGSDADATAKLRSEISELNGKLWGKGSTRSRHVSHARTAGNSGPITHALEESITRLSLDVEDLDSDALTVNTQSGILRVSVVDMCDSGAGKVAEVVLEDHAREVKVAGKNQPQYITKMMPVDYDPDAICPTFDKFLIRVLPDPMERAFVQRWFGLSMTALPVQKFLYAYGMGANGKSLLANLMRRMLGDYATMVKIQSLTGQNRKSGSDATPDLMRLIGARAALTSEPEEGERMQEQKIKEMTGGDEMLVRALHSDFVAFTPYFKLTFTGNHKLDIRGTDDGIWRRPMLLHFGVQIPEGDRDEKLGDRLFDTERSGILNWMIAGLLDYLEGGLQEPESVKEATAEYRRDSDPIGDFLTNACEISGGSDWLSARDLIDACYLYQLENAAHAWTPGVLSRKLKDRATKFTHPDTGKTYVPKKSGVTGYSGIRLTAAMRASLDAAPRDGKGLPEMRQARD